MITVTGAAMVLSTLPGARTGLRSVLAPGVVRKTNLAGEPLALVGPRRANSYALRKSSTGTGSGSHVEWVRASQNSWSRASCEIGVLMAATFDGSDLLRILVASP